MYIKETYLQFAGQARSCTCCGGILFRIKYWQGCGTSSLGDEADIKDEAVSLCHAEFKPEINWLERKAPYFWVEAVTFKANQEVNYIIKIYENDSDRNFHLPSLLLIPPKKANWIKWCFIPANYGVHIGSFRKKKRGGGPDAEWKRRPTQSAVTWPNGKWGCFVPKRLCWWSNMVIIQKRDEKNEGRKAARRSFSAKSPWQKNKAILGRQHTGEMASYWTGIDCTLRKSGSLALCQCKHPQISARRNSIPLPFWKLFFLFFFLILCVMAEQCRKKQLRSREEWIAGLCNHSQRIKWTNCAIYKSLHTAAVHPMLLPIRFHPQTCFKL